MNSPFEYVNLDMQHVDENTMERAGRVQVDRANNGRGFVAISQAVPEVYYQVDLLFDNSGFCNCPDFVFRKAKQGRPCKHIVALDKHITEINRSRRGQ
jgi:predicted nucleic acid-binding Zn finger protein